MARMQQALVWAQCRLTLLYARKTIGSTHLILVCLKFFIAQAAYGVGGQKKSGVVTSNRRLYWLASTRF